MVPPLLFSTFVRSIAWGSTDSITEPEPYTEEWCVTVIGLGRGWEARCAKRMVYTPDLVVDACREGMDVFRDRVDNAGCTDRSSASDRNVFLQTEIDRGVDARGQVLRSGDVFVRRSTEQDAEGTGWLVPGIKSR